MSKIIFNNNLGGTGGSTVLPPPKRIDSHRF